MDEHDDHGDLPTALRAYERLIEGGPDSSEAERAREAIQRIHALRVHLADGRVIPVGELPLRRAANPIDVPGRAAPERHDDGRADPARGEAGRP